MEAVLGRGGQDKAVEAETRPLRTNEALEAVLRPLRPKCDRGGLAKAIEAVM